MMQREPPGKLWCRPRQDCDNALSLFSTEDVIAQLHVSKDEMRRWHEQGWLSFNAESKPQLMVQDTWEIEFVRNIARSGFSDCQITELLQGLPRPLKYDPTRTAYHFEYGWVSPLDYHFDIVERYVSDWIEELAGEGDLGKLQQLVWEINEQIHAITQDGEEDEAEDEQ